jgi:hypothetical protein
MINEMPWIAANGIAEVSNKHHSGSPIHAAHGLREEDFE